MIAFGPFLTKSEHPDFTGDGFAHTGYSMEMVVDGDHHILPIYQDATQLSGQFAPFNDFYFPEPQVGWPVEFTYRGFHEKPIWNGRLVSVSPLLMEIFRTLKPAVGLVDFLREFRALIPVSASREPGWLYKPNCPVNLTQELTAEGYIVAGIMSYGVSLTVDIAWCFRDDYQGWQKIDAGQMEFRPRCGKLNNGKWNPRRWRECIEDHFENRLKALASSKPIECLRSEEDIENLLSHFEWTLSTRHSEQEIRQMRVELVNSARHLWESPKDLAKLLQKEGLYAESTSLHQIVKFLPSLMAETGGLSREKSNR
jgi:hypothetical protein